VPRIRTIKPEFPQSESMGLVSRDARLCFLMLWTLSDDEGRTRGHSRALASLLFPYDDDAPSQIDAWLSELEREGCIVRYAVDGAHYVSVANWMSHQKIDRPTPSKFPAPPERIANDREPSRSIPVGSGSGSKDLGSGSEDPALTGGIATCGNVEKSTATPKRHDDNPAAVGAVVRHILTTLKTPYDIADVKEEAKCQCAKMGLNYDAAVVAKAFDAAEHQIRRTA